MNESTRRDYFGKVSQTGGKEQAASLAGWLPGLLFVIEQGAETDNVWFVRSGHGIRLGGHDQGVHVRGHQLQVRVLLEESVDLFFEGRHR